MAVAVILVKGFPYVALEHLCHKTVSCSANGSYLLKNGTAFSTIFQRSFQSINLTPNAANTDKDLFFSSGVLGIIYLTILDFIYYSGVYNNHQCILHYSITKNKHNYLYLRYKSYTYIIFGCDAVGRKVTTKMISTDTGFGA